MVNEKRLESFMAEVVIIQKPVHRFAKQINMDWFLYDRNFRHEQVNPLVLAGIHQDILFDYDKTIDIYASKYQRRILLINPLSKN